MTALRLQSWDVAKARQDIPDLREPKPNYACWVGSVAIDDKPGFSAFISKAKQGDIQSLTQFQHLGGDLAYAVLLNLANERWKLVVIESPEDPALIEQAVFASIVCLEISIDVYHRQLTQEERQLMEDCRRPLQFRNIFKEWLKGWFRFK